MGWVWGMESILGVVLMVWEDKLVNKLVRV